MAKKKTQKNEMVLDSNANENIITAEDLIKKHKISLDEWIVVKKYINKWDVWKKDEKTGISVKVPMFQTKVHLEKNIQKEFYDKIRESFVTDLKKISPKVTLKKYPKKNDGVLLEINIFDFHFGKMAWAEETGENFDTKIAKELFKQAISEIIEKSKGYNIDKILFPIGNDFFNSDYSHPYNRTTNGTPQEEDLRWQKTFREGRQLLCEAIIQLTELAPVDVLIIPGNHDFEKSFYLGDSLEGWFHNNKNVNINNLASPRKYYKYGNVLLGFTHGNNENISDLNNVMSHECKDVWSEVKYKEFHLGHFHHKKEIKYTSTQEVNGTIIRFMSSLTAADAWHHRKAFVGANRTAEAFIWGKDNGLQAQLYFNL